MGSKQPPNDPAFVSSLNPDQPFDAPFLRRQFRFSSKTVLTMHYAIHMEEGLYLMHGIS